jgi:hypothetical protein
MAVLAAVLMAGGAAAIAVASTSQYHAPRPTAAAAGTTSPAGQQAAAGPGHPTNGATPLAPPVSPVPAASAIEGHVLPASAPISIAIPAIGVQSPLQALGLNPDGTIEVPQPGPFYNEAAWYKYSPTPGQPGPSVIEGHIDSAAEGPSVFFRLGALKPGDQIDITLADHTVAVFTVSGVRQYPKDAFPTATVYGHTDFAALRLLTCGGSFDRAAHSYRSNTVVFASLTSSHPTA